MRYGKRRGHRWKKVLLTVGILCAAAGAGVTVWLYKQKQEIEAQIAEREYEKQASILFQREELVYEGKTYRRNTAVKAILCIGVDRKGTLEEETVHTLSGQADGLFLIAQDTVNNTSKILMIPRDSMTEITMTDLSGNVLGKDRQHVTLAYAYGDGREKSCELVEEAVSGLLGGLSIDHYMATDMEVINILNDSVGGVTVTIPSEGMEKRYPEFVKGAQVTLHGTQAEAFIRYRDVDEFNSAYYRMERHKEFIGQFFGTVKKQASVNSGIITELFDQIETYMITDMAKDEYLKMAMNALNIDGIHDEDFLTVPGEAVQTAVYDEYHVDRKELTPMILSLFYRESN